MSQDRQLSTGSAQDFRAYELKTSAGELIMTIIVTANTPPTSFTALTHHEFIFYADTNLWEQHGTGDLELWNVAEDDESYLGAFNEADADISLPNNGFTAASSGDWIYSASNRAFEHTNGAGETRAVVVQFSGSTISHLGWARQSSTLNHVLFSSLTVGNKLTLTSVDTPLDSTWDKSSIILEP